MGRVFRLGLMMALLLFVALAAAWLGGFLVIPEIPRPRALGVIIDRGLDPWRVRELELPQDCARVNSKRYRATGVDASLFPAPNRIETAAW